jgi:hypothetical protein
VSSVLTVGVLSIAVSGQGRVVMDQLGLAIQRGKVAVACQACAFLVEA